MVIMNSGEGTLHEAMQAARRAAGLTQSELARKAGCQQSAISMFESGRPDILSEEKIQSIARILGVDPAKLPAATPAGASPATLKFCPDAMCPSNTPYLVGRRLCHSPSLVLAPSGGAMRCRLCGELLEASCPGCGKAASPGAFCDSCGEPYVVSGLGRGGDPEAWIARWRRNVDILRGSLRLQWIGEPGAAGPGRSRGDRERERGGETT